MEEGKIDELPLGFGGLARDHLSHNVARDRPQTRQDDLAKHLGVSRAFLIFILLLLLTQLHDVVHRVAHDKAVFFTLGGKRIDWAERAHRLIHELLVLRLEQALPLEVLLIFQLLCLLLRCLGLGGFFGTRVASVQFAVLGRCSQIRLENLIHIPVVSVDVEQALVLPRNCLSIANFVVGSLRTFDHRRRAN